MSKPIDYASLKAVLDSSTEDMVSIPRDDLSAMLKFIVDTEHTFAAIRQAINELRA